MNKELLNLFRADQNEDRTTARYGTPGHWELRQRELKRRERVSAILESGAATAPEDYYHAAVIFQRSDNLDDIWQTHTLAVAAAKLGHRPARWLAASSLNRWLTCQGTPGRYPRESADPARREAAVPEPPAPAQGSERARWNVAALEKTGNDESSRTGKCRERSAKGNTPSWLDEPLYRWHPS